MRYIGIIILFLIFNKTDAQQRKYIYYFDDNLSPVSKGQATVIGRGIKTNAGVSVNFFLLKTNEKVLSSEFTDSTLNIADGKQIVYKGRRLVSSQNFKNNVLDGPSLHWDEKGNLADSTNYRNGTKLDDTKFTYSKNGSLVKSNFVNTLNNVMNVVYFDTLKNKSSEVLFIGDFGVWNYYRNDTIYKTDSVFTRSETDASYPSKAEGWRKFLERTLDAAIPTRRGARPGTYEVVVQFLIDTDGTVSDITPLTNHGYGMEEEVARVIKKSGKWAPAVQYGKKVKGYRRQPITFQIFGKPNSNSTSIGGRTSGYY